MFLKLEFKMCSCINQNWNWLFSAFGVACHLGVLLDIPTLGVAKKLFHVDGLEKNDLHLAKVSFPQCLLNPFSTNIVKIRKTESMWMRMLKCKRQRELHLNTVLIGEVNFKVTFHIDWLIENLPKLDKGLHKIMLCH